jgi:hypothetical protein
LSFSPISLLSNQGEERIQEEEEDLCIINEEKGTIGLWGGGKDPWHTIKEEALIERNIPLFQVN